MKVGYLAHPVAPDAAVNYEQNLQEIKELLLFLNADCGLNVQAPYLGNLLAGLPDTGSIRERSLAMNCRVLQGYDYILTTGHKTSSGMQIECDAWFAQRRGTMNIIPLLGLSFEDIKKIIEEDYPELIDDKHEA